MEIKREDVDKFEGNLKSWAKKGKRRYFKHMTDIKTAVFSLILFTSYHHQPRQLGSILLKEKKAPLKIGCLSIFKYYAKILVVKNYRSATRIKR